MSMAAAQLRKTRKHLKFTQAEFAALIGVHPVSISKWEREAADLPAYQASLIFHIAGGTSSNDGTKGIVREIFYRAGPIPCLAYCLQHYGTAIRNERERAR